YSQGLFRVEERAATAGTQRAFFSQPGLVSRGRQQHRSVSAAERQDLHECEGLAQTRPVIFRRLAAGFAFNIYWTSLQPDSRSRDRIGGRTRGPGQFCAVNARAARV